MKVCSRCHNEKCEDDFYRNKSRSDGLDSSCRDCAKRANKAYYDAHSEVIRAQVSEYRAAHPDRKKIGSAQAEAQSPAKTQEFIARATGVHGDKYDYALTKYLTCDIPVIIICPLDGHGEFSQPPFNHLSLRQGCPICGSLQGGLVLRKAIAGEIPSKYWSAIMSGAKTRDIPVNLSAEEAWSLFVDQSGQCALTGVPIAFNVGVAKNRSLLHTASLDRIRSSGIYEIGNVQWVHKRINQIKMNMAEDEFVAWCLRVVEHSTRASLSQAA